jgi:hypothetical protein
MSVENHDEQFEKYLSGFQPRRPRALPQPAIDHQIQLRRFAAAAAIGALLGASLWSAWQEPTSQKTITVATNQSVAVKDQTPSRALSTVELTRLAVENPSGLDAALEAAQENRLPSFDRKDSVLRILAESDVGGEKEK